MHNANTCHTYTLSHTYAHVFKSTGYTDTNTHTNAQTHKHTNTQTNTRTHAQAQIKLIDFGLAREVQQSNGGNRFMGDQGSGEEMTSKTGTYRCQH